MSRSLSRLNSVISQCSRAESAMSTFGRYGRIVRVPHTPLVPGLWIQVLDAVDRLTRRWNLALAQLVADDKSRLRAVRLVGPVWPLALRVMPIVRSSFCWSVLEGMGCLARSRRYLGDVVFWRKGDIDTGGRPPHTFAACCRSPHRVTGATDPVHREEHYPSARAQGVAYRWYVLPPTLDPLRGQGTLRLAPSSHTW